MSRQLDIDTRRSELLQVFPRDIVVDEGENGRAFCYTEDDCLDLLEDLEAGKGIKVPVECRPVNYDGKKTLKLVAGYRRHKAAVIFNAAHPDNPVRIMVVVKEINTEQALIDNIDENLRRKALTPPDFAKIVAKLENHGRDRAEIAQILRCSESQVGQYLEVGMLPERIQRLAARRGTSMDTLLTLRALPDEEQESALEEALKRAGVTVEEVASGRRKLEAKVVREVAREKGADVGSMRMSEFKKYLENAVEREGPGSTAGAVRLQKQLLRFLEGKFGEKAMDNVFDECCKSRL
jgi:ParB/RepB/Spo0J family partition protein